MTDFTNAVKANGWKMKELAKRWGITPRQMSRISSSPKQLHWDAIAGLRPSETETGQCSGQILYHIIACADCQREIEALNRPLGFEVYPMSKEERRKGMNEYLATWHDQDAAAKVARDLRVEGWPGEGVYERVVGERAALVEKKFEAGLSDEKNERVEYLTRIKRGIEEAEDGRWRNDK